MTLSRQMTVTATLLVSLLGCRAEQSDLAAFIANGKAQPIDKAEFSLPVLAITPLSYQAQGSPFSLPNDVVVQVNEQKDHCRPNARSAPIAIKVGEHSLKGVVLKENQPIALVALADGQLIGREVGQTFDSGTYVGVITEISSQGMQVAQFDTGEPQCVLPSSVAANVSLSSQAIVVANEPREGKQGVGQ
ncbi:hypothetical protein BIY21_17795 [Vibrio ponticus]|uniref:Uncharacterized protein n=1 Tax=Vibrio ponticus TaxID=265668 RepID=A0ABX3F7Z0_9VIBR|nr:pilus assembly protein PilP [Vibrio ponticus]OLQ86736.1 hypothetical protein BIY21_17795 [Vibrio ponticus]